MDYTLLTQCMRGLARDIPELTKIDHYLAGKHPDPYMPRLADAEYRLLAERCVTNLIPSLVNIPAQSLYVDGVRSGDMDAEQEALSASHWEHWQRSRMDAGQSQVHRAALAYGHSFVVTEKAGGKVLSRGLSPLRTFAAYEHPATDIDPVAVFSVVDWPGAANDQTGVALFWDEKFVHEVAFEGLWDEKPKVLSSTPHRAGTVPVTRFAAAVDLEGRTVGTIAPMMILQDRVNQTVFDLLVAQSGGSFVTRTVTGMAPPMKMVEKRTVDEFGEEEISIVPELDDAGRPIPEKIRLSAGDFMYADNPDAKFGSLPGTPLDGYIASLNAALRHFTTISQTPPHYMLGEIANLSAEALQAAETSLSRKVAEFRTVFGESWERVFRVAAFLEGDRAAADDFAAEVLWRDMDAQAMSKTADALVKLRELGIPDEGLWARIPGATQQEIDMWRMLKEQEPDASLARSMEQAGQMLDEPVLEVGGDTSSLPEENGPVRRDWSA